VRRHHQPPAVAAGRLSSSSVSTCRRTLAVLGRRDLPSRGLPPSIDAGSPTPLKRCRVDSLPRRPTHGDVIDDVTDDWNKENRPRQRRRARVDCDAESPINHVYHTLEPTVADLDRIDASTFSHVYETIDFDDAVDASSQRHRLPSSSQRQRHSAIHKIKKRVTFNVSSIHALSCF